METKFKMPPIEEVEDNTPTEDINDKIFIPNWHNKPPEVPPVLCLNGIGILTHGNITAVIASPGAGKSSICEAICATHLNNDVDCLGFEGDKNFRGVIYCDFERTEQDVWNSFSRMAKRANINFGDSTDKVILVGMRSIPRLSQRLDAITNLLENNPCSLLILDGSGDLVTDTNDLEQAIECRILFREWTVKYNLSVFTTLHPNPSSEKPRGHIGSEICRESESVLLAKRIENDTHSLTTDFDFGKNRNNSHINTAYKWNDEAMMFLSVEMPVKQSKNQKKSAYEIDNIDHAKTLLEIFAGDIKPKRADLKTRIGIYYKKLLNDSLSQRQVDEYIDYFINDKGWIAKVGKDRSPNAYYVLLTETLTQTPLEQTETD